MRFHLFFFVMRLKVWSLKRRFCSRRRRLLAKRPDELLNSRHCAAEKKTTTAAARSWKGSFEVMKVAMMLSYCYLINSLQRTPVTKKKKKKSIIIFFYLLANQTLEADTEKRCTSVRGGVRSGCGGGGLLKELAFRSQVPPSLCSGWQMPCG